MTGKQLHEKYRPRTFDEVIGHRSVVKSLQDRLSRGRAQAFLFTGPAGIGKTTFGRIIARAIGCDMDSGLVEIDAGKYSGVEELRQVTDLALFKGITGDDNKVFIIDECHGLSAQAWKTLLKIVEEPPKGVYWIFCTTEAHKVPATIKSRCASYNLKPLERDDIWDLVDYVIKKEKISVSDDVLKLVVKQSKGSARQALANLEVCDGVSSLSKARELLETVDEQKNVTDLCRYLMNPQPRSWKEAMKYLTPFVDQQAEGVRIVILAYFTKALIGTINDRTAVRCMAIMEEFEHPYPVQSDRFVSLALSVGRILFGGRGNG